MNWIIHGRGFLWIMWLKEARASSMFLNEEEEASFLCLYLLLLLPLLLLLEEEMELECLLDKSDGRIIPVIFIRHRWTWDPMKKASEAPRLTAAAATIISLPLCYSFSSWSCFFIDQNDRDSLYKSGRLKKVIWGSRTVSLTYTRNARFLFCDYCLNS